MKNKKYKTHPAVKVLLVLALAVSLTAVAGTSFCMIKMKKTVAEYEEKTERCKREAYLSFAEAVGEIEAGHDVMRPQASSALSRYELFSGERYAELHAYINSGAASFGNISFVLGENIDKSMRIAEETAERISADAISSEHGEAADADGWQYLKYLPFVSENDARRLARKLLGGGASLERVEDHGYPPVYRYGCRNASVTVTRPGGKLLLMYAFRVGNAEMRSEDECRREAKSFLRKAGIADAVLVSENVGDDAAGYVFLGCVRRDGAPVPEDSLTVFINVKRRGAAVMLFDARGYYRQKSGSI